MRRTAMCVAMVLGGCTQASPPERPGGSETKAQSGDAKPSAELPVAWTDPARTHVLLGKHVREAKTARFVAVALDGGKVLPVHDVEAMPLPDGPDRFTSVSAHGGGSRWVTQRPAADGVELVALDVADPTQVVAVALPKPADAMHLVGQSVFVGIGNGIYRVDLRQPSPQAELQLERALPGGKAYDVFVREGSWLFAIDDIVRPIYGDSFRVQADGTPTHDQGFELPSMINGRYHAGALEVTGEGSGTLFVLGGYGIMSGHGQDLAALPIEGGRPKHDGELVLNSTVSTDPPVLEEHVDRGTGTPAKLVAGSEYTAWSGVELVGTGDRSLLLPAGARGLLAIPAAFTPDTKAQVVFAEPALDVEVDGQRVFVLTGKQLVELSWSQPLPTEKGRIELPEAFDRIVH